MDMIQGLHMHRAALDEQAPAVTFAFHLMLAVP
jgi:hypothetical protein